MMRAGVHADHARRAKLFHEYLEQGDFFRANLGNGQQVFVSRALPHWETAEPGTEILTCDNVEELIEQTTKFGVGICSCRHEQEHLTTRKCKTPLETCTVLGASADYLIRHQMARPIERTEMREVLARSRESGWVLSSDNVKEGVGFICHCCPCCCNLVRGITERGFSNAISTAPYVPNCDQAKCDSCGRCVKRCPVGALSSIDANCDTGHRPRAPKLDESRCLGCGVCVAQCTRDALHLKPSAKRRILPENTFERALLQALERGNIQNFMFDDPERRSHQVMRTLIGGIMRLPRVQRLLLSDAFRSRFLRGLAVVSGDSGP
jgi:ferredoxin